MKKYEVDLLISHHQVRLENRNYDDSYCQWGDINIQQGALLFEGFVSFDPIPDETFGAKVILSISDKHVIKDDVHRSIVIPFLYNKEYPLKISSALESHNISFELDDGLYQLYFDILEKDEVYYQFTLIKSNDKVMAKYLINDDFGGVAGKEIHFGSL
ncbi:hypothetical protein CRV00_06290 [Malaciobacter molluscorum]|uniref:competence protein ComJ n=1 Tax=Malaciobacter molluscorum TaxID=1032072 RepID=UPI00100A6AA4|nr:competence protein ComJ [Malaciobacter molluscorum]RXJ94532.1 hypothetical protein CRV00_06290 [Malaciobacter molluscorum]